MSTLSVVEQVIEIIQHKVTDTANEVSILADTPLRDVWLMLDSVQIVELIVQLEIQYGITLPDELLGHVDNIEYTVAILADVIEKETSEQLT